MQTFVPYPDFALSAECLDRQRLGKQRVENLQIMKAIQVPGAGWANHPAVKMWRATPGSLVAYQRAIVTEWLARGYKDTCWEKTLDVWHFTFGPDMGPTAYQMPEWWGRVDVHLSHQSNLVRKDPAHYRQYFHDVPDDLEYVWPVP